MPHPDEGTLHAFIDGELSMAEATALEAHVAECGLCEASLAEARGFVAGASRAISALDAAPSSGSRPVVARPEMLPAALPSSRPFIFRIPFARAAALLLLAGGSAVVINRLAPDGSAAPGAESLTADAALTEERAGRPLAVQAVPVPTSIAASAPPIAGRDLSTRGVDAGAGAATQKRLVPPSAPATSMPTAERTANDGRAATEQAPPQRAAAAISSVEAQSDRVAGLAGAPPTPTASVSISPPPARMAAPQEISLSAAAPSARVTRYRTKDGVTLTLTEEPLRTSFAEESTAARRGVARSAAQASAPVMNTYRWLSAEQGKSFTLTGALSVVELEALSKRLHELERVR